jgi:DNA-binding GntR family transcriptional regulator
MAAGSRSPTRAAGVLAAMRADVLGGRVRPGQALPVAELADRLGVSVTVVREALTRLSGEGLVFLEPRVGFRVVELSVEHLVDLTRIRIEIETLAVRMAVRDGDRRWEADLVAAHHLLATTPIENVLRHGNVDDAWWILHASFHRLLSSGCGSPVLMEVRDRLWNATELYLRWSLDTDDPDYLTHAIEEHQAMVGAVMARDGDAITRLVATHIQSTANVLLSSVEARTGHLSESDPAIS